MSSGDCPCKLKNCPHKKKSSDIVLPKLKPKRSYCPCPVEVCPNRKPQPAQKSISSASTSSASSNTATTSTVKKKSYLSQFNLLPVPDITQFDNEPYMKNPLLTLNMHTARLKYVHKQMVINASQAKRRAKEMPIVIRPEDIQLPINKNQFKKILRETAESVVPPPMQLNWERNIRDRIPRNLRNKFSKTVEKLMADAKEEFNKGLHDHGVHRTLKPLSGEKWPGITTQEFKYPGRTSNRHLYLKRREYIKNNLFITRKYVRSILRHSVQMLPNILLDYGIYRDRGMFEFNKLKTAMSLDLHKATKIISQDWYPKITSTLAKDYKMIPQRYKAKYLLSVQGYITLQIRNILIATIEHFVEVVSNPYRIPFLKVELFFETDIETYPTLTEIYSMYHNVVCDIATAAQYLPTLQSILKLDPPEYDFLQVRLVEIYMENVHKRLQEILFIRYCPLREYVEGLESNFDVLFSESALDELENYINEEHTFEEGCVMINYYRDIISQLQDIPMNIYFDVGKMGQIDFTDSMKNCAQKLINDVLSGMKLHHKTENLRICDEFADLAQKALRLPTSTEELMESGTYMLWVNTVYMQQLKNRIAEQLLLMGRFLEMTELEKDHVALNTKIINWVTDIKPIFELNSANYEVYKYEFEENLQRAVDKLNYQLDSMTPYAAYFNFMDDLNNVTEYIKYIRLFVKQIFIFDAQKAWINKEERLFKMNQTEYPLLEVFRNFVYPFYNLMYSCVKWQRYYYNWMDGPFELLEGPFIEETTDVYIKDMMKLSKMYRNKIRQDIIDEAPLQFSGVCDDPRFENLPSPIKLCLTMLTYLKDFRENIPLINALANPALKQRHWDEMSIIVGFDITPDAGTSMRKFINLDFGKDIEQFEIISSGACKELQLITNLNIMMSEWKTVCFTTSPYKDTGIEILSGLDEVQAILDDHLVKTLSMRGSAFVKPFESTVRAWYEKLNRINTTIEEWGTVQAQWLYLLPIFSSKDIVAQMPEEGILFADVDGTYRRYMQTVAKDPRVIETAPLPGLLEAFKVCTEQLDTINKGVNAYLEKKRLYFPRFFFLSNDEMLEILSETKDPLRVQPHLKKCFEGINKLEFDPMYNISALYSAETEKIILVDQISTAEARGSVEKWLVQVEEQMLKSIRQESEHSYMDYIETRREVWVTRWPGMVVLCISQIYWAMDVHQCMEVHQLSEIQNFHEILVKQLNDVVSLIRSPLITTLARITIKALIVIDVHAKDVVQELIDKKVVYDTDFLWMSQLRYYWVNDVRVRITNADVRYAYEYLGNSDRLVITPLTDRCYRTLIGAYHLHLNGAPEGPAGTGKTETTKDLAKAIAVQCVVFNCSDGLDYKAMGKFFKGLASSGAWACFDEFNRIELEVLSVIAQQILCIIQAVRNHLQTFEFEGTILKLNPACYVCITMNPGYAGRSELPDNLKVLFRTVAMMVPDYAMIGEISLYSFGFINARSLSVKIVTVYRLCSEQLSSQNHYDYGMRAVKSVLSACGNNKLKFPDEDEDIILLRSITDVNLPKFLSFDVPLFQGIISDLFPGTVLPEPDYKIFLEALIICCTEMILQPKECVITKVIQTYEMMIVRHGFMLVGDPFAGKTCTLKLLANTMTRLHNEGYELYQATKYAFINPKAITMGQLYGAFDPVSYEWTDGVGATIFRDFATEPTPDRKWVIFDGPVDAVWIENMNTVLDDNKKLCLTSGEVITMSNSMSMIFEVMDLTQASPATVSRCGMIYMEPATLGWEPLVESWLILANPLWREGYENIIEGLFRWLVTPTLYFVRKTCRQLAPAGEMNLAKTTMQIFELLMNDAIQENSEIDDISKYVMVWFEASLLYAVTWGVGGILDLDSRDKFDIFHKNIWKGLDPNIPYPDVMEKVDMSIPSEGMLMDYFYYFKLKGCWKYWPEVIKAPQKGTGEESQAPSCTAELIPTIDTGRYTHQLSLHIKHKIPMLLVGPTGTGKSFYIQSYLMNKLPESLYEPGFMTFTTQTSANQTQELIISKLVKKRRGLYGPSKGKLCVIFIDDLNMPAKEIYGAQPPIELLRQYFDHKHWYDLKDTTKLYVRDVLFVTAMGLPGGSRQVIYNRFLRHFCIYSINEFSDDSMQKIFSLVLLSGLKKHNFPSDVMISIQPIVYATLRIYNQAISELRPTPMKSHYVFNLRDVSRVIQGCALIRKESVKDRDIFGILWVHEIERVFGDRLIENSDRLWLLSEMSKCLNDFFKERINYLLHNYVNENEEVTLESLRDLMFGTFMDQESLDDEKKYEEVKSHDGYIRIALQSLEEFNATHKNKMNIVLFKYVLEHLSRICRILAMPSGNSLLVGVGGSGRQSLTRLATSIMGYSEFQPEISKNYNMTAWRDDLKRVLKGSGGIGKDLVFLFTEGQIKEEGFLQDIDCLLNSGEVPNIFQIDEKQEILELVRLAAQGGNRNLDVSPLQIFSFFIGRVKAKLHIILCFSPIGSAFRVRLRLYPSLVNCCTINWMENWPEDSLEMVAQRYMTDINLPEEVKQNAVVACKYFHVGARIISDEYFANVGRKTYITSASYLDLIKAFSSLTNKKQKETMTAKMRYVIGLQKLLNAASAISVMQTELNSLKPELVLMAEKSTKMSAQIAIETAEAEKTTAQVKKDEAAANIQAAEAETLKKDCEKDLAAAIPILEEALSALNTLKPADIVLVKSMKNPPDTVKLVMAAVCVIQNVLPDKIPDPDNPGKKMLDYWGPSKKLLNDMNFLQNLKEFDKDNINPAAMAKIRKEYLTHPSFKPKIVAKASSAAEGLCKWIIAMDLYDDVAKIVGPKKAKLAEAERSFSQTMAILNEKIALAEALDAKVAMLNEALEQANIKKQELEDDVEMCINKLFRAEKLIGGLGGEKSRWTDAAENLQNLFDNLAGDILVSCGMIAYLAPFTAVYRNKCIDDWRSFCISLKIPCSTEYSFGVVLGSEIKIQNWYIAGLPRDSFSTDNAIIQDSSYRWSLLVDPQGQANKWIKTMEKVNDIHVVKFSDATYMKTLETCIESGKPVLIENILEDLEAPLDPLLAKQTFRQGGVDYMSLGDSVVEYNKKFRLYLTSKLRNPHYLPEIFNKVTLINFSLTVDGLEDQLLGIVVAKERPDLQEKRQNLIVEGAANKAALKQTEDSILRTLSESKGDILADAKAIEILDNSKVLSDSILKKQEIAKETEIKIESFRLSYRPIAIHSANLYYCVTDLPNVDPMYQYSLLWFINLYIFSIDSSSKSKEIERRLRFLRDTFTYNLYQNVCRSLFEKDKLLFSFVLCTKIMLGKHEIEYSELMFLLTGGAQIENLLKNPSPNWLDEKSWDQICRVDHLKSFKGFRESFVQHVKEWQAVYDLADPQNAQFPKPWNDTLTGFQKLILIRLIRPDRLTTSITLFVEKEMGVKFIQPPGFDIAMSFNESNCLAPLIFILSAGTDPMDALIQFAEVKGFSDKFSYISLGQGQGPIAKKMIENGQAVGSWVCLQNCHLASSWMTELEKIWEGFDLENTVLQFRLWLTSYPSDKFPTSILQHGVKMTNEPPTGLKANLMRSYISEPVKDETFFEGCPGKSNIFARLLYGICFFHGVVQERRKFGPLGWNIPYGFNESDFQISVRQLQMFVNEFDEIQYAAVSYLTGECNYGGRVTDTWDRRLIVTLLNAFINEKVIFDPNYLFTPAGPEYGLPRKNDYKAYLAHINALPMMQTPEVYGLHMNAGITRDFAGSMLLVDTMLLVQGEVGGGGGSGGDELLLTMIAETLAKLPRLFDLEEAKAKFPVLYSESMNTVLVQEMERFNKLLLEIKTSTSALEKAIKGLIVMTGPLEAVGNAIAIGKIPDSWAKVSYPSLKSVSAYITDFVDRLHMLKLWFENGKPDNFWLSGFFFTQAFLTGAMQNFARKYIIPIDTLTFDYQILSVERRKGFPQDGVYIYGLFLDGARWNWNVGQLEEQLPKVLNDTMPLIWLKPILIVNFEEGARYKSPLYKTSERRGILATTGHSSNYVLPFYLPTDKNVEHWIKRSVALLCQLN